MSAAGIPARLTAEQLAEESETTRGRIEQLVAIGVLKPSPGPRFSQADIQRVRIVAAYEDGGIELAFIERAIAEGRMTFEFTDRLYPIPSQRAGRTVAEFETELDVPGVVGQLYLALGLAQPPPDRALTVEDVALLRAFLLAWAHVDDGGATMLRAARIFGEGTRRAVDAWVALFLESVAIGAEEAATLKLDEFVPRVVQPGERVAQLMEPLVLWLLHRHLERELNAMNVEQMEEALAVRGLRPRTVSDPPAVVFADLTGFTRLTEELGDDVAARHASALTTIAASTAGRRGGRLIKELGDGVMLVFPAIEAAADGARELRDAAHAAGLPPLHIGITTGPLVERDGDIFGRTVNLAARLSAAAAADEILLASPGSGPLVDDVEPRDPIQLKGFADPVAVVRLRG